MKSISAGLLAGLAMFGIFDRPSSGHGDEIAEGLMEPKKKPIPPNHKEYTFNGITVTALSRKRAIKKVERILNQKKS